MYILSKHNTQSVFLFDPQVLQFDEGQSGRQYPESPIINPTGQVRHSSEEPL
jgi:hypothetical protein